MKAMVVFERTADQKWQPVTVYQATPGKLFGKTLPGNPIRDKNVADILATAGRPMVDGYTGEMGTMEDWIMWAQDAMSNGHDKWTSLVVPEKTIDMLYQREVIGVEPQPMMRPDLRPTVEAPQLKGRRAPVKP